MPEKTAAELIAQLKGSGLLVVKEDLYYFIPLSVMNECLLPAAFLKDAPDISEKFFKKENAGAAVASSGTGQVFKKMDQMLGDFRIADGVRQAVWVNPVEDLGGKDVSKSKSDQVIFVYSKSPDQIVVDMSKGGRPSNS